MGRSDSKKWEALTQNNGKVRLKKMRRSDPKKRSTDQKKIGRADQKMGKTDSKK